MIQPTIHDIGRKVVYRPHPGAEPQEGVITTLARHRAAKTHTFVRFHGPGGELTPLDKLEWIA